MLKNHKQVHADCYGERGSRTVSVSFVGECILFYYVTT